MEQIFEEQNFSEDKMRSEIGAVKGIGEVRLNQIMEIIKDNLNIKADE